MGIFIKFLQGSETMDSLCDDDTPLLCDSDTPLYRKIMR